MAQISFDKNYNVNIPTLLLQNRNFDTIGIIREVTDLIYKENFNAANELSFTIYKKLDETFQLWDSIINFKIIYIPEFKERFEITVSESEENDIKKHITASSLCESELSNIKLYDIEINTDEDILNQNYDENFKTLFYRNPENYNDYDWSDSKYENYTEEDKKRIIKNSSLLHRLLEKAPHYSIAHVDSTIANIQRSFSISDTDIYSELSGEIAEEFNCLFIFDSMERSISVYDLYNTCNHCGYRGDFSEYCPECGSNSFYGQYGKDTTIFISTENLSSEISLETNKDSVKNCFYIEGGDEIITSAIRSINPNASSYIYNFTKEMLDDMPYDLSNTINNYNRIYEEYIKTHHYNLTESTIENYNSVVNYVNSRFPNNKKQYLLLSNPIIGYPSTTSFMYEVIDLYEFISDSMLPVIDISEDNIDTSMKRIIEGFESGFSTEEHTFHNEIALDNYTTAILSTIENTIKNNAKIFYNTAYYTFDVETKFYRQATDERNGEWHGNFILTSRVKTDDEGKKIVKVTDKDIHLTISNRIVLFIEQKIYRAISGKDKIQMYDISNLKLEEENFRKQLELYSLHELQNLSDSFQVCLDIVLSIDIEDNAENQKLLEKYDSFYSKRKKIIDEEIVKRDAMLNYIKNVYYFDANKNTISGELYDIRVETNNILNFEKYVKSNFNGVNLWNTFCSYRREDKYSNSNYISDGLTNAEIIQKAKELFDTAKKELYKASHYQYSFSSTMNNLLSLDGFYPLVDHFSCGNWIRICIDNNIYKLRLISYQINYDNIQNINVEFSTTETLWSGISDIKSILDSATSMSQSYSGVMHQMEQSKNTTECVNTWFSEGLNATKTKFVNSDNQDIVIDNHGILARLYDDITDSYGKHQLKILGNGLYLTDDKWETITTALGKISYVDPETKNHIEDYGIIAKTVIGKLILGENLGIYNENGSMKFTNNGFSISNLNSGENKNTFIVNPNDPDRMLKIIRGDEDVFYTDNAGNLHMKGTLDIVDGSFDGNITAKGTISGGTISGGKIIGASIEGGSINIGDNNFYVDSSGNLSAKNCNLQGDTKTDTITATNDIIIRTQSISSNIEELNNRCSSTFSRVSILEENFEECIRLISIQFASFRTSISSIEKRLDDIESKLSSIEKRSDDIESKLSIK